ncbi:MAG: hypothetical protein ACLTYW_02565 [Collinsella sp.]
MMTMLGRASRQLQEAASCVNVQNVQDNKFPQRFRVIQNDETIYESGIVETGKTVETCPAGDIEEGEAYIEIRHSTPRPMTTTAIRRASRSGWNRPS